MSPGCEYSTGDCPETVADCPCVYALHHDDRDSPRGIHQCPHGTTSGFLYDPRIAGEKEEDE